MIQANELRIGNWYSWYADGKNYYYQVEAKDFVSDNIKNFEPITLTEEILLKCGFEKIGFSFNKIGLNLIPIRDLYYRANYPIKADILYLHQLQNLYFALTGKELTVNL